MEIITEQDYKTNHWQGGITRELFIYPEGSSLNDRNFDLRISSAIIEQTESVFSDFSGYTRYIMPLAGDITLGLRDQHISLQPCRLFRFSGSDKVTSCNSPGATDFNVIYRNGLPIDVQILSNAPLPPPRRLTVVFALETLTLDHKPLPQYATALLRAASTLEGTAVVIQF